MIMDKITGIFTESWLIMGQMSPYLLFGFLVAGVLSEVISPAWVEKHLGGRGLGSVLQASLFGVPLPLCSCGVIPVAASLRHQGASKAATTSFLLSTPQTGVDSIAVTYAMLGPVFAVFRPLVALITGIIGGGLVLIFGDAKGKSRNESETGTGCTDACCSTNPKSGVFKRIIDYGFVRLPADIGSALLLGILIAGLMAVLIPQGFLAAYIGGGVFSILLMMLAGIPVYVCATASVPIAAGFMHMGASAGAALAFLIAGPATNAAAFTTTWNVLGRRTALLYLITIAGSALGSGLLLNWMMPLFESGAPLSSGNTHIMNESGWLTHIWAAGLLLVVMISYMVKWRRSKALSESKPELYMETTPNIQRLEFFITGMKCSHCADSVERGLTGGGGAQSARVDLKSGRAMVTGENLDRERLYNIVRRLGYDVKVKL